MTPGPGHYQAKTYTGSEGRKITISGRPNTSQTRAGIPGPGQYSVTLTNRPKSPSYRIGSAKRDGFNFFESNPGPGQYSPTNYASNKPKSPNWSMGTSQRKGMSFNEIVPGPGNYNVSKGLGAGPKVI
jgi:hypothetical protein